MRGPIGRGTAAPCHRVARATLLTAALVAGGCDVRDEPIRTAGRTGLWPGAAAGEAWADGPARQADAVVYVDGYAAAARHATAEGRPLLLVFGASWCRWSGELARGPLADHDVVARTHRFVCARVDADRDAATCRDFGVEAFPTVIVLDEDGRERFRAAGSTAAERLAAALDAVPTRGAARLAGEATDVPR